MDLIHWWSLIAAVALATAAVSVAISKSKIFRWLRRRTSGPIHGLVICHFCLNFWIAGILLLLTMEPYSGLLVKWLATVTLATFASGALIYAVGFPDNIEEFDAQKESELEN